MLGELKVLHPGSEPPRFFSVVLDSSIACQCQLSKLRRPLLRHPPLHRLPPTAVIAETISAREAAPRAARQQIGRRGSAAASIQSGSIQPALPHFFHG